MARSDVCPFPSLHEAGGATWGALVDWPLKLPGQCVPNYTTIADFEDKVELHKGRHSTVWSARCRRSGRVVVVKAYYRQKLKPRQLLNVHREITLLRLFSQSGCPGVVKLLSHFDDDESLFLVCEACMRGDLYQTLVKSKGGLREEYVCNKVVIPLLSILDQTHKLHIVHRDIKPENIFITLGGDIQLGDFGLAVHKQQDSLTERVGTLDYMAPEVLSMPTPDEVAFKGKKVPDHPYDEKVDIWAVGILVYELLTGRPPFEVEDPKETARLILSGRIRNWPACLSSLATDFIRLALSRKAADRPAAEELLRHPWVRSHVGESGLPVRHCFRSLKEMVEAGSRLNCLAELDGPDAGRLGGDAFPQNDQCLSPASLASATSTHKALSAGDDPFLFDKDSATSHPLARGLNTPFMVSSPPAWAAGVAASGESFTSTLNQLLRLGLKSTLSVPLRAKSVAGGTPAPGLNPAFGGVGAVAYVSHPPLSSRSAGGAENGGGAKSMMGSVVRRDSSGTSEFLIDIPRRDSSHMCSTSDDGSTCSTASASVALAAVQASPPYFSAVPPAGQLVTPRAMSMACMASTGDRYAIIANVGGGCGGGGGQPSPMSPPPLVIPDQFGMPAYNNRSFSASAKCTPKTKSRFA